MKTKIVKSLQKSITASVTMPGSKSYTNRALIMAALTNGSVKLMNPLVSDDTEAMMSCLEAIGIRIQKEENAIIVENDISEIQDQTYDLFARISGTTIRFILALACVVPGIKKVFGSEGLNKRPIGTLVEGLKQLGASIQYEAEEGYPPVIVSSSKLHAGTVTLHGDISSQFFSALLMIAPVIGDLTIAVEGNQISKSYIDITLSMMKEWGVNVENQHYQKYLIKGNQSYEMKEYVIEGDFSAAGYFFAIAALTKSTITLQNMNADSVQGDKEFLNILEQMGNEVRYGKNEITMIGHGVKPLEVDMEQCPDQAQTLAVLSAFAPGKTVLTGVRSLRVKETERVKAVQQELLKMGIQTESPNADTLIIHGGNPVSASIDTYGDHRMAMSFAVAGTVLSGMKINNPEVVNKTFPEFWEKLEQIEVKTSS